jgi:hypothetical protein
MVSGDCARRANGSKHGLKAVFPVNRHIHFLAIGANRIFDPFNPLKVAEARKGWTDAKSAFSSFCLAKLLPNVTMHPFSWGRHSCLPRSFPTKLEAIE